MHVYFVDIDGTFYVQGLILEEDREAIFAARARGDKVFINTARAAVALPEEIKAMPFDGFICSCGQVLITGGQVLYNHTIEPEKLKTAIELCDRAGASALFYGVEEKRTYKEEGDEIASFDELKSINQFYVHSTISPAMREEFSAHFRVRNVRYSANRVLDTLRCVPPGVNKSDGIRLAERFCGIRHEDTVAIGDTDDDIGMIRYAAVGIAIGDGTADARENADFVTGPVTEAGMAYAMNHPELWEHR